VSHLDDKVFIHIPKTGGTSIRETLGLNTKFYHKRLRDFEETPLNTFTVVRNPYDRAVSMCAHQQKDKSLTPEIFTEWCLKETSPRLYKKYDICFADPMLDFITVDNKIVVKDIIRFENLGKDIKKFFSIDLLHINKTNREEYQQYYNEISYSIITERYAEDIKTFNYTFS
jgi:hypothetical protein